MDARPSLLFLGHAFHLKSRSHAFMLELLEPRFDVTCVHVEPEAADGDPALAALAGRSFDVALCWQVPPPLRVLGTLAIRRTVFFPMYDQVARWGLERWMPYRRLRIVSFSSTLARRLERWGFDVHAFRYFPEPGPEVPPGDPARAFFWHRTEKVSLARVAALLEGTGLTGLHLHDALDPGQRSLEPRGGTGLQVTRTTWFDRREDLRAAMASCGLYVAPRLYEGIGMSFLEAMAMGRCVAAADRPTMNEYLRHGENGLLFDPKGSAPLVLGDVAALGRAARATVVEGRAAWEREAARIPDLLLEAPAPPRARMGAFLALRVLAAPAKVASALDLLSLRIRHGRWRLRLLGREWSGGRRRTP